MYEVACKDWIKFVCTEMRNDFLHFMLMFLIQCKIYNMLAIHVYNYTVLSNGILYEIISQFSRVEIQ